MPPQRNLAQVAALLAARIAAQVERGASKGVEAAAVFLASRVKETLSVPAPRKRVVSRGGAIYYRATTRATPGAPPRKLSGRLRASVFSRKISGRKAEVIVSTKYAGPLERSDHKYLKPTYEKYRNEIRTIVGQNVRAELG